jgi:hypothetical protein
MSDILDDLKMLADHCDQENGDEPCDLGMLLIRAIGEIRKLRSQPVSAAEVPMPDGYDLIDRFLRNNLDDDDYAEYMDGLQQYGEQCRAAGFAVGVAAGGKDAERYRAALIKLSCLGNGDRPGNSEGNEIAIAALRGEVKP